MGVYLSSPVTEKNSIDEECRNFVYGASSMQGWRITQEDAHNCIPVFDEKTKTSFFAVYDGHGGSEVAKYCERHFPDFVKKMMESADGTGDDPTHLIQNAFLAFDATLTNDDVIKELKELAGKDDDIEEDEDDDPVGRTETDMLKEEANMPLDQLLAQYKSSTAEDIKNASKNENFQSPALEAKVSSSDAGTSSQDAKNGPSSDSSMFISSSSSSSSATLTESDNAGSGSVSNGVSNKNNSYNPSQSQNPDNTTVNNNDMDNNPGDNNNIDTVADSTNSNVCESETGEAQSSTPQKKKGKSQSASTDGQAPGGSKGKSSNSLSSSSSSSTSQAGGNASGAGSSANSIDGPSGSGTSQHSGERSSKAKAAVDMANMDGAMDTSDDDDDEDEDEDAWEDMSEDDDEDDDDEEEEDHDEDVPMMDMTNEEPGSDSGCTACVALMQGKKLIVANAGDSRCILSRAGKAIELSFDHKPEDDCERERIEKAGGKVTADGRVNGGLNLSRAIGDHVYKRNKDLPAREQMITALPDIETAELGEEDQFIVIACDGIWNYMSSQEVVDYVLEKLKDPMKRKAPSVICEELFDHCLAPNTFGDGTGCDNMTCIIIILDTFKPTETQVANTEAAAVGKDEKNKEVEEEEDSLLSQQSEEETGPGTLKRCADNVDVNQSKRLKVEEEVA